MKDTALQEKIDSLPDALKEQVSDFIDFLLYRYGDAQPLLSPEEKNELDKRWETYQQDTSSIRDLEDVKVRLQKKYGISN